MADYDAIVIGAGNGGVSAGALLAKQGRKVLLLEQGPRVGGCCSSFSKDGYQFDVGASIVEVVDTIETAFQKLGTSFHDEVDLIPCDPLYSYIFADGSCIEYPKSLDGTADVIKKLCAEDGQNWAQLADYFSEMMKQTISAFASTPSNTMLDMVRMSMKNPKMVKFLPLFFNSYQDMIQKYFKDETVQSTMSFQSFYGGLPPELAPGFFAAISYSEHEGIFYPRGGMIQIPQAFQKCGEKLGMETRLDTRVERVIVRDGRAYGVLLSDGTEITCDTVVSDVNAKTLYLDMIGEEHLPWLARMGIKSCELSMSCCMIYIGVDYMPPLKAHHNLTIGPMEMMNEYWWDYHVKGIVPDKVHALISWPSEADPSLCPEGHNTLNLMCLGPNPLSGTDWDREKKRYAEMIVDGLSECAVPGLKEHITMMDICTPLDFERRLLSPGGAIYGIQMDLPHTSVFRPAAKSKSIKGLYLVGASTHPGGSVPLTIASGSIASELIDKYEN